MFVELMTDKKNRDTGPEINVPSILDFVESFIDSWDLMLLTLDKSLQGLCLLLGNKLK